MPSRCRLQTRGAIWNLESHPGVMKRKRAEERGESSMTVRDRIQQVGFVMVLLLMVFVISNDVIKLFGGGSPEPEKPPAAAASPAK